MFSEISNDSKTPYFFVEIYIFRTFMYYVLYIFLSFRLYIYIYIYMLRATQPSKVFSTNAHSPPSKSSGRQNATQNQQSGVKMSVTFYYCLCFFAILDTLKNEETPCGSDLRLVYVLRYFTHSPNLAVQLFENT